MVAGFPDPLAFGSGSGNLANSLVEQNDHSSLPLLHRPCVFLCFSTLSFFLCFVESSGFPVLWPKKQQHCYSVKLCFQSCPFAYFYLCLPSLQNQYSQQSGPNLFEEGRTKSVSEIITSSGIFSLSNFQSLVHISPPCLNHVCLPFFTTVFLNVDCFTSLFQRTTS